MRERLNGYCHEFAVQDSQFKEVESLISPLYVSAFTGVRGADLIRLWRKHP